MELFRKPEIDDKFVGFIKSTDYRPTDQSNTDPPTQ